MMVTMKFFVIFLAILVGGNYVQGQDPCPYKQGSDCCSFKFTHSGPSDPDYATCTDGSAWSSSVCSCVAAKTVNCDTQTCAASTWTNNVDTECRNVTTLDPAFECCQDGRHYIHSNEATHGPEEYVFEGRRMRCHPGMTFSLVLCGCVGNAIIETTPSGP